MQFGLADHHTGMHIDDVLALVRQMRAVVFDFHNTRIRVGLAFPIGIRRLFAFTFAIEPPGIHDWLESRE